ncbi:hypothetical protein OF83DRAFT_1279176 [Amylostereum chailletii]|nr:hypothetical protein OF83DRAFT_1279176 [Amylostereum chailletii]
MSSREAMWYCHECHAEMRPLMVPDPHCASCNGTFVEKIESEDDDPRAFQESGPAYDDGAGLGFGGPPALDNFFDLAQLLGGVPRSPTPGGATSLPSQQRSQTQTSGGSGFRFQFNTVGPGGGSRTFVLGGPNTLGGNRTQTDAEGPSIAGPLMAQYLLSMLSQRGQQGGRGDPFSGINLFGGAPEDGRWGDYVFNQEALDQIVTQIMENSNSSRPVPATDEIMTKLDRTVLEEGSDLLERDCAVCKDQFSLTSEDPDEQVVVTLPCTHPFHESCIMPWLKTSGTCPVCRHQLVPQPDHHAPDGPNRTGSPGSSSQGGPSGQSGGGMLSTLFNMMGGGSSGGSSNSTSTSSSNQTSSAGRSSGNQVSSANSARRSSQSSQGSVPGGWWD